MPFNERTVNGWFEKFPKQFWTLTTIVWLFGGIGFLFFGLFFTGFSHSPISMGSIRYSEGKYECVSEHGVRDRRAYVYVDGIEYWETFSTVEGLKRPYRCMLQIHNEVVKIAWSHSQETSQRILLAVYWPSDGQQTVDGISSAKRIEWFNQNITNKSLLYCLKAIIIFFGISILYRLFRKAQTNG